MMRLRTGRPDRPRAAARRDRRGAARGRARPDQRLGGVGPARRLGRRARACRGAWRRCRDRPDPQSAGRRARAARGLLLFALAGLGVGYVALGLSADERGWIAGLLRASRASAAPRRAGPRSTRRRARSPPRRRGRARPSPSPSPPGRSSPAARASTQAGRSQPSLALGDTYVLPTHRPAGARAREGQAADRPRRARAQRAAARKRARGFPRPRRHRRGPPGPGRHDVRARAGERDQGEPGDPACRRHRPQHVGAVGARRDHSRAAA